MKGTAVAGVKRDKRKLQHLRPIFNNVRQLASDEVQAAYPQLEEVPKSITTWAAFNTMRETEAARYPLLQAFHRVQRHEEEIAALHQGTARA